VASVGAARTEEKAGYSVLDDIVRKKKTKDEERTVSSIGSGQAAHVEGT